MITGVIPCCTFAYAVRVSLGQQVREDVSARRHRRPCGLRTVLVYGVQEHGAVRYSLVGAAAVQHADYSISGQGVQGKAGDTLDLLDADIITLRLVEF